MANPNRVYAYLPKRSPIEVISCRSLSHAHEVAAEKRAAGFDAKATQSKTGRRGAGLRAFTVYVYQKLSKVEG